PGQGTGPGGPRQPAPTAPGRGFDLDRLFHQREATAWAQIREGFGEGVAGEKGFRSPAESPFHAAHLRAPTVRPRGAVSCGRTPSFRVDPRRAAGPGARRGSSLRRRGTGDDGGGAV